MIIDKTQGKVRVNNGEHAFSFDHTDSSLTVHGLTFDQARGMLAALEGGLPVTNGVLTAANGKSIYQAAADELAEARETAATRQPELPHTNGAANGKANGKPTVDPTKIAAIAAANPKPPPAAPKKGKPAKEPPVQAAPDPEDIPFPESADVAGNDGGEEEETAAAPPAKGKAAVDLPENVVNAKKLRDVLVYLMDEPNNLTNLDEIKARCAELKDSIPMLGRLADMDSRIERTFEVMDVGSDLS